MCSVAEIGRFWSLDSGLYLDIESVSPRWKRALGAECAERYLKFRRNLDALLQDSGGDILKLAEGEREFLCWNRLQN